MKQFYLIQRHRYREGLELTAPWLEKIETEKIAPVYSTQQYLVTLANYLLCAFRCEELDLLPPIIAKIKGIKSLNENEESDCFRLSAQYELLYLLNDGDFQNADFILKQIEAGMNKYKHIIAERQIVSFQCNIVLLNFLQRKYKETLKQIVHLHHLCGRDERYAPIVSMARVIEWMCQMSEGNYNILGSSLRNLKQYFKDRDVKNDFFDRIFEIFNGIIKEAGIKPASRRAFYEKITKTEAPPEWGQMKELVLSWLS